jgi:hypothetical protein
MDPTLPRRLRDYCPRCQGSLDCMVFIGLTTDQRLVMVCEACHAELVDSSEPACLRPAAIADLASGGPDNTADPDEAERAR